MSMVTDIQRAMRKAVDQLREPAAIVMSVHSLSKLTDTLRSEDSSRRNFMLKAVHGIPHIWNPRLKKLEPLRVKSWTYEDKAKGIKLDVPIIADPMMVDEGFLIHFSGRTIQPVIPRTDPDWYLHPEGDGKTITPRDSGKVAT